MSARYLRKLRRVVAPLSLSLALAAGCGSSGISGDALRAARGATAEMTDVERRAVELTELLTATLADPDATPEQAVRALRDVVNHNVEEMNFVAETIRAKVATLSGDELRQYLEGAAEETSASTFAWRDTYFRFQRANPELSDALRAAVMTMGYQIPPVRRPHEDED